MKSSPLVEAFANLDDSEVASLVRSKIDAGSDPLSVVKELRKGIDIVGERYKKGAYFLC